MSRDKLLRELLIERFGPTRKTAVEAAKDPPKAVARRRRELAEALAVAPRTIRRIVPGALLGQEGP